MDTLRLNTSADKYRYYRNTAVTELGVAGLTGMYALGSIAEGKGSMTSIVSAGLVSLAAFADSSRRVKRINELFDSHAPIDEIIETTATIEDIGHSATQQPPVSTSAPEHRTPDSSH